MNTERPTRTSLRPSLRPPANTPARTRTSMPPGPRRCPVHDLALSPEGTCMRCGGAPRARTRQGAEPLIEEASRQTKLAWALLGACVLGALLWLSGRGDGPAAGRSRGLVVEAPEVVPDTPDTPDSSQEDATAAREAARARAREARRAQALREARARVPITMYSTTWCGVCRQARAYLDAQGISYTERDVESDPEALATHARLNPRRSVPTFDIGGETMTGFSVATFERTLDQAAARALP